MYQISKRLTITGAFLGLACGFLLTQQLTKATTNSTGGYTNNASS